MISMDYHISDYIQGSNVPRYSEI